MAETKQPLAARCETCGHIWATLWIPAPVERIAKSYRCPWCGERKAVVMATDAQAARIVPLFVAEEA